jgi:hypothetical protein
MITLTQYGRMAEKHWREFLPKMVQELEAKGQLHEMLQEAEEKTKDDMEDLTRKLISAQDYTPEAAERVAWEMVRERYILLPPEES